MSTKAYRAARRPPCGCTMVAKRAKCPCMKAGTLWRCTLAQIDFVSKEKYVLACSYHVTVLRRRGTITHVEDALL